MKKILVSLLAVVAVSAVAQANNETPAHGSPAAATTDAKKETTPATAPKKGMKVGTGTTGAESATKVAPAGERDGSGNAPNHAAPVKPKGH